MASPQVENGHTEIANEIIEALWKVNLSAYESRVLWYLFRKTYGWKKKTDRIALSQFAKDIGLDRRLVHRAIKNLSSKKMIVIYRDDKNNVRYGFQKNYEFWKVSSKKMTVIYMDDDLSSKEIPTKEIQNKNNIYVESAKKVLARINELSGKRFTNYDPIMKVLKSLKVTEEDCLLVVNFKWNDSFIREKYFTPDSLFRISKFKGKLDEAKNANEGVWKPDKPRPEHKIITQENADELYN